MHCSDVLSASNFFQVRAGCVACQADHCTPHAASNASKKAGAGDASCLLLGGFVHCAHGAVLWTPVQSALAPTAGMSRACRTGWKCSA